MTVNEGPLRLYLLYKTSVLTRLMMASKYRLKHVAYMSMHNFN